MNNRISESVSLKDLPMQERHKERLEKNGAGNLSNTELHAIIFDSGVKGEPVLNLSQRLLKHFGSLGGIFYNNTIIGNWNFKIEIISGRIHLFSYIFSAHGLSIYFIY